MMKNDEELVCKYQDFYKLLEIIEIIKIIEYIFK